MGYFLLFIANHLLVLHIVLWLKLNQTLTTNVKRKMLTLNITVEVIWVILEGMGKPDLLWS